MLGLVDMHDQSLKTFGPGQPLAARARWRRAFTPWMSASPVSQSEGATMWSASLSNGGTRLLHSRRSVALGGPWADSASRKLWRPTIAELKDALD